MTAPGTMHVKVVVPSRVVAEREDVAFLSAEGEEGSVGVLPRCLDFVSILVPGILTLRVASGADGGRAPGGREEHAAVDRGLLVKEGRGITVAARRAVMGGDLADLRATVEEEYRRLDEREKEARAALTGLEARFARRFMEQERRLRRR